MKHIVQQLLDWILDWVFDKINLNITFDGDLMAPSGDEAWW